MCNGPPGEKLFGPGDLSVGLGTITEPCLVTEIIVKRKMYSRS